VWDNFAKGLFYCPGNIDQPESYHRLKGFLAELDEQRGTRGNRVFYLSVAPRFFGEATEQLGEAGMLADPSKQRLVIENPLARIWPRRGC
jgi:glucose-6-phosphate 1-dehydrogenase